MNLPSRLSALPVISLTDPSLHDRSRLRDHVDFVRGNAPSGIVWGGYLEKRQIYASSSNFMEKGLPRNIHLGVDVFADAGSEVCAPMSGTVHSFADNFGESNYGPTIILAHEGPTGKFHTLYGHLSRESLEGMEKGKEITGGGIVGTLGAAEVNGNWPPHLHFQIVVDMGRWEADYPGACTDADLEWYMGNCPDPMDFMD